VSEPRRVLGAVDAVLDLGDLEVGIDEEIESQPVGAQVQAVDEIVALLVEQPYFRGRLGRLPVGGS
jgi:hypothetical protein